MKTDNVYVAILNIVKEIEKGDYSGFRLCGVPLYDSRILYKPLKPVLVLYKTNEYGEVVVKDLNSKDNYSLEIPFQVGKVFVNSASLYPFNKLIDNPKSNLSKRKILKMGNQIINETMKKMKEEENKK